MGVLVLVVGVERPIDNDGVAVDRNDRTALQAQIGLRRLRLAHTGKALRLAHLQQRRLRHVRAIPAIDIGPPAGHRDRAVGIEALVEFRGDIRAIGERVVGALRIVGERQRAGRLVEDFGDARMIVVGGDVAVDDHAVARDDAGIEVLHRNRVRLGAMARHRDLHDLRRGNLHVPAETPPRIHEDAILIVGERDGHRERPGSGEALVQDGGGRGERRGRDGDRDCGNGGQKLVHDPNIPLSIFRVRARR